MNKYVVYFTNENGPQSFDAIDIRNALNFMENMRKQVREGAKITHIVLSTEDPNQTGSPGVDEIIDGKLPDGSNYTWNKSHRAGGADSTQHSIIDNRSNR